MTTSEIKQILEKEAATTARVMRAFPAEQMVFKPHERSSDAMTLMKTFVFEMDLIKGYAFGQSLDPARFKEYAPADRDAVIADFEQSVAEIVPLLDAASDDQFAETVEFGGKSHVKRDLVMMLVHDQIHHRGQLSVYVRMAGGLVPSIYGPSADDDGTNL